MATFYGQVKGNYTQTVGHVMYEKLADLADRIRKLAKKDGERA